MGTRYIDIKQAKEKAAPVPNKNVIMPVGCKSFFAKNLPFDLEEEELKTQFGIVSDVRMMHKWENKQFKKFAYIDQKKLFEHLEEELVSLS